MRSPMLAHFIRDFTHETGHFEENLTGGAVVGQIRLGYGWLG